jgi:hypothetical protein
MTGRDINDLTRDGLKKFGRIRDKSITIYQQEKEYFVTEGFGRAQIM